MDSWIFMISMDFQGSAGQSVNQLKGVELSYWKLASLDSCSPGRLAAPVILLEYLMLQDGGW